MFRAVLTLSVVALLAAPPAALAVQVDSAAARDAHGVQSAKPPAPKKFKRAATVKLSAAEVTEGERLTVNVKIASPRRAKRVVLQRWDVPLYYGTATWKPAASVKANGRSRVNFSRVAVGPDTERYRVQVTYKKAKPVVSKPAQAKVWRWVSLQKFTPYYATVGTAFSQQTLNGREYPAWGGYYGSYRSWEAKFTPGRNCKEFRGVVALADHSDDGSSGAIVLSADDRTVYQSPELTPGMEATMRVPLVAPYRIWLQALNTSDEGIRAYPNIGDPALLCNYA